MISHIIPKQKYFAILQPSDGTWHSKRMLSHKDKIFEIEDPKTKIVTKARFIDCFMDTCVNGDKGDFLFQLAFGIKARPVLKHLIATFPELYVQDSRFEIWLMERA